MRKQLFTGITTLGLLLALAAASVHAQSRTIVATIPFDFRVGGAEFKSGSYAVTARSEVMLMIRNEDTPNAAVRLTKTIKADKASGETKLVFHRYGQHYFLSEVWVAGESSGRQLLKSRQELSMEKELAAINSKSERAQAGYARVELLATLR